MGESAGEVGVEVVEGAILISSVWLLVDQPDAKVLLVDCTSKRPEVSAVGAASIYLYKGPDTLNAEDSSEPSCIEITGLDDEWSVSTYARRHSVHIFLWKSNEGRKVFPKEVA